MANPVVVELRGQEIVVLHEHDIQTLDLHTLASASLWPPLAYEDIVVHGKQPTWRPRAKALRDFQAELLPDGRLLVFGGDMLQTTSCEHRYEVFACFDAVKNRWTGEIDIRLCREVWAHRRQRCDHFSAMIGSPPLDLANRGREVLAILPGAHGSHSDEALMRCSADARTEEQRQRGTGDERWQVHLKVWSADGARLRTTPPLEPPRSSCGAARLRDGTIVVVGGVLGGGVLTNLTEVFRPGSNEWRPLFVARRSQPR